MRLSSFSALGDDYQSLALANADLEMLAPFRPMSSIMGYTGGLHTEIFQPCALQSTWPLGMQIHGKATAFQTSPHLARIMLLNRP